MNLPALGSMRFQLRSQGETLSTVIQTERDDTLALVEDNLPKLRQALEKIGFNVTRLNAFQGPFEPDDQRPPTDLSLLSEKA
jgi:flagellar hook-length control protein FliK